MPASVIWSPENGDILLGVMGDPIAQSKSPLMHMEALRALGISGAYVPLHIKPEFLGEAIQAIRTLGFRGLNVTIPHKVAVMEYLDEVDATAKDIGAVNTIVNENGRLIGYNTDGIGYVRSLKTEVIAELAGTRIVILGAGGAARGIAAALLQENPASVVIANRSVDRAMELATDLQGKGNITGASMDQLPELLGGMDVVINTTSVGMYPHMDETPVNTALFHSSMVISDLIYNPFQTRLLQDSQELGCRIHGGLGMFVYQGAYALEYWTGRPAPVEVMWQTMLQALGSPQQK
ncbi:shikimate dehydrogenase [Paenibacillus sp. sgz500958]|uniref:shikimate dehydrogenase n=1 Tax=Paenibacillus sp. sgz500958 TaxID=3242475 RepID=UPI0036D2E0F3